ncbi:hypothetical protein Tco_1368107 [Tanacetum coccineum]
MSKSAERAQTPANSVVRNTAGKGSKQATEGPPGFLPEDRLREICEKHYNQILPIMAEKVHQEKLKGVQTRLSYSESSRQKAQTKEKTQLSESESCDRKRRTKKRRSQFHRKGSKQATEVPSGFLLEDKLREIYENHYNQILPIMTEKVHKEKLQGVQTRLTYSESSR